MRAGQLLVQRLCKNPVFARQFVVGSVSAHSVKYSRKASALSEHFGRWELPKFASAGRLNFLDTAARISLPPIWKTALWLTSASLGSSQRETWQQHMQRREMVKLDGASNKLASTSSNHSKALGWLYSDVLLTKVMCSWPPELFRSIRLTITSMA